jgi:hypothetical protein
MDSFPGCKRVAVHGKLSPETKAHIESRYVIGPVISASFWEGERKDMVNIRGPC